MIDIKNVNYVTSLIPHIEQGNRNIANLTSSITQLTDVIITLHCLFSNVKDDKRSKRMMEYDVIRRHLLCDISPLVRLIGNVDIKEDGMGHVDTMINKIPDLNTVTINISCSINIHQRSILAIECILGILLRLQHGTYYAGDLLLILLLSHL